MFATDVVIVLSLLAFLVLLFAISAAFSVSGQWEREEVLHTGEGPIKERFSLGQLGPFIVGRREMSGGHQSFSGYMIGRTLYLKRRDFGLDLLMRQGFPADVAKKLEGEVMGQMRLRLSSDRFFLDGSFTPYKIEFSHTPPAILAIRPQKMVQRRYRRVVPLADKVPAQAMQAETKF